CRSDRESLPAPGSSRSITYFGILISFAANNWQSASRTLTAAPTQEFHMLPRPGEASPERLQVAIALCARHIIHHQGKASFRQTFRDHQIVLAAKILDG